MYFIIMSVFLLIHIQGNALSAEEFDAMWNEINQLRPEDATAGTDTLPVIISLFFSFTVASTMHYVTEYIFICYIRAIHFNPNISLL